MRYARQQSILVAIYEKKNYLYLYRRIDAVAQSKNFYLSGISSNISKGHINARNPWIWCNIYRMSRLRCHSDNKYTEMRTITFYLNEVSVYQNMRTRFVIWYWYWAWTCGMIKCNMDKYSGRVEIKEKKKRKENDTWCVVYIIKVLAFDLKYET